MPQLTTAFMNESIDIERLTGSETLDDRGNVSTSFSASSTSVQARIVVRENESENVEDGLDQDLRKLRVIVPSGTDVTVRDRVSYDSIKWNIRGVKNVKDRFGNTFYKQLMLESGY